VQERGTLFISAQTPVYAGMICGENSRPGDIVVNVDNLDTDDDYEELAEKVSAVLMERIGRTAAIGGLHIRSI
jgi:predicted membrane GTPase involved in stress response